MFSDAALKIAVALNVPHNAGILHHEVKGAAEMVAFQTAFGSSENPFPGSSYGVQAWINNGNIGTMMWNWTNWATDHHGIRRQIPQRVGFAYEPGTNSSERWDMVQMMPWPKVVAWCFYLLDMDREFIEPLCMFRGFVTAHEQMEAVLGLDERVKQMRASGVQASSYNYSFE